MRLTRITAHSFRNLSPDPVFFGSGTTLVAGENAQGKTNLLEAVALVCGQRSFRRARPAAMAAGAEGFRVEACLARGPAVENLAVAWTPDGGRSFTRAGKVIGFREASRLAPAVFFSPEHRELLTGARSPRRRFLDRLALLCRPCHMWVHGKENTERVFLGEIEPTAEQKMSMPSLLDLLEESAEANA